MEARFLISPRILDHLGVAAYTSLQKCLAELCSNCYDADADNVRIELPNKYDKNSKIIISDDGNGMSSEDIIERYMFIGYNRRKKDGQTSPNKKRPLIGNKGIGKLAGFGVAHTIELISVKDNVESRLVMNKEIFDNFNTLSDCSINIETSKTSKPNGTELILSNLSDQLAPIAPDSLRQHLFKVLPKKRDFKIKVNGIRCSAQDVHGKKIPLSLEIDKLGTVEGYYVIAESRQTQPGVIIRVRNRAVTEPSLFGLEKRSHFSFGAEKIVGEINADFLDEFINTSRDNFLAEAAEVQALNLYLYDFFKNVVEEIEKQAATKRTKKIIEAADIQVKLESLPPHIRTRARAVIEGVIAKAQLASDDEVQELVDWIVRYFESNVLRELMSSILQADSNDIEKLSELIKDWGLRQVNSVTQLIKDEIEIIKKMEELTDSDKTLEMELHKLIESNLWLIKEGLELWASDKPLKKIFDKEFNQLYKKNEAQRPDILCRSQGAKAIILEFKRPKVRVTMEHVTQALKYDALVQEHRPNLSIDTYIIGRTYDADVRAAKEKFEKLNLYLWSFSEILQQARGRFERVLKLFDA